MGLTVIPNGTVVEPRVCRHLRREFESGPLGCSHAVERALLVGTWRRVDRRPATERSGCRVEAVMGPATATVGGDEQSPPSPRHVHGAVREPRRQTVKPRASARTVRRRAFPRSTPIDADAPSRRLARGGCRGGAHRTTSRQPAGGRRGRRRPSQFHPAGRTVSSSVECVEICRGGLSAVVRCFPPRFARRERRPVPCLTHDRLENEWVGADSNRRPARRRAIGIALGSAPHRHGVP